MKFVLQGGEKPFISDEQRSIYKPGCGGKMGGSDNGKNLRETCQRKTPLTGK